MCKTELNQKNGYNQLKVGLFSSSSSLSLSGASLSITLAVYLIVLDFHVVPCCAKQEASHLDSGQ